MLFEEGDYIAYRAGASSAAGLIPNGDFEAVGTTPLDTFGAPIYGWSSSPDTALAGGGAQSEAAHLVLTHLAETETTKQTTSSTVALSDEDSLGVQGFVRAGTANQSVVRATVALLELDAAREFVAWHTTTVELPVGGDWQEIRIEPADLDPTTAFVYVSCFLEPGGSPGDAAEFDDIVVDPGR